MQTIMIVEDEKVIRDAIVQELEKWNYEVVAVEDFSQVYTQFFSHQSAVGDSGYYIAVL